jgi:hypothetical protein
MVAMARENPYANLPEVIEVLALEDAGEFGAANCPHCGAEGRYVYRFTCADGSERGAMRGCFKHFPKHRFAERCAKILAKEKDNRTASRQSWGEPRKLASWDQETLDAIRNFAAGRIQEWEADDIIRRADGRKRAWMKSRGYTR